MHIPDGLMSLDVLIVGWLIAIPVLALAIMKVNKNIDKRTVPFMAVLAAGIFVAQMLNFPVGGGTTGHLVGTTLAVVLLGPWAGMLIITTIVVIQGLIFGDGGLTAMGLNILNMAIVAGVVSWAVIRLFPEDRGLYAVPIAAWLAIVIASLACALELSASFALSGGTYGIEASLAIPAMLGYHAIIGIGEAIITSGVVLYLEKVAPDMLEMRIRTDGKADLEVSA